MDTESEKKEIVSSFDEDTIIASVSPIFDEEKAHDARDSRPPPPPSREAKPKNRFHPYTFSRPERLTQPPRAFFPDRDVRLRERPIPQLGKFWLHMTLGFEESVSNDKQDRFQQSVHVYLSKPMHWVFPNTDGKDPRNVIRIFWNPIHDNIFETEVSMHDSDANRIVQCKMQYLVQKACEYNDIDKRDVRVTCTVLKVL